MSRHLRFIAAASGFLLVVVLAAAAVLPARWLALLPPRSSLIQIGAAQGTLWSGQAQILVGVAGQQRSLPEPLRWNFSLVDGPALVLRHAWLKGPLTISLHLDGLGVSAQSLRAPAFVLTTMHGLFNSLQPGGSLALQWAALRLNWRGGLSSAQPDGQLAQLQWLAASSALAPGLELGSYSARLNARDPSFWALQLQSSQGPLLLAGDGSWSAASGWQFTGSAWADPAAPLAKRAALQSILLALGPAASADGRRILRVSS